MDVSRPDIAGEAPSPQALDPILCVSPGPLSDGIVGGGAG